MVIELILTAILIVAKMSSTTRYLKNANKRSRKAISPVIATVILVAVAVVIAAAMAGFAGSLFGSYSQNSQIKIRDATFSSGAKTVTINFVNSGSAPESLLKVLVPFGTTTLNANGTSLAPNPATLQPNTTTQVVATFTGTMPTAGQQITLTAVTSGGQQYTFNTVVS
jgi:flagellin-like protein